MLVGGTTSANPSINTDLCMAGTDVIQILKGYIIVELIKVNGLVKHTGYIGWVALFGAE